MSEYVTNTDTLKGGSSKKGDSVEKAPTSRALNPTAQPFVPKSAKSVNVDATKTTPGLEVSGKKTQEQDDFPEYQETHGIPVWISQDSGQELSASQQRRRRRWRKAAREAEERAAEKEKADLQAQYRKINAQGAEGSNKGNRRLRKKWRSQGLLNDDKPKNDESK
ncbi:uncharacterized protein FTOL_03269 [Fusarium torulosum]|uniref:Uncharacterized protein n=1 Tax=Fusarium torulosum TaxID=33205 RepID=A0AAE8M3K6_9HYPO|nr:uncharacterized protein FTOL_03269 [Fusarium torulosum]